MAIYKHATFLTKSEDDAFDKEHKPGVPAPFSGIYRCKGCGREVASNYNEPLPPQSHHQHPPGQGDILWRLIVFAEHKPR